MFRLIIFLFIEIMVCQLFCQAPNIDLNKSISKTVLISYKNANSSGSGFILFDTKSTYLISAKHVFINSKNSTNKYNAIDSILFIIFYSYDFFLDPPDTIEVNLHEAIRSNFFQIDSLSDIAVLMIGKLGDMVNNVGTTSFLPFVKRITKNTQLNGFVYNQIIRFDDIGIGNELFIVGYPKSLELKNIRQYEFNRPLVRKGILAGKSYNLNTLVIDCPSYKGNSGGPVLYVKRELYKDKNIETYPLLGVISQFIPYEEKWYNASYNLTNVQWENSGYSVIVPIENVLYFIKTHF